MLLQFKNIYDIEKEYTIFKIINVCLHEKFVIQNQPEFPYVYVHAFKYDNIFHFGIIF